jgi:hypothetical protein
MPRHWLNYASSNRAAAELILQKAAAGDESVSCLIGWARRILHQVEPAPAQLTHSEAEQLQLAIDQDDARDERKKQP